MRRILLLILVWLTTSLVWKDVSALHPAEISVQGRLTNSSGAPLVGTYSVLFRICYDSIGGAIGYQTTKTITTDALGLFSTVLPNIDNTLGMYYDSTLYLGIQVGSDPELTPRTRFTAVPWAVRVRSIEGTYGGGIIGQVHIDDGLSVYKGQGTAVLGRSINNSNSPNTGVHGWADNSTYLNFGVYGEAHDANGSSNSAGVYGRAFSDFGGAIWAGYFDGWVHVTGGFSAGSKAFKIDDPTDPTNSTLMHSCVESDEYKNVYDGTVALDASGEANVSLPSWFSALNKDFRYQLTAIGAPGPNLHISQKIIGEQFRIAGGNPGMEVSWQVTGVRKDPYALAHPVEVQKAKPVALRGKYLHPKEYGVSEKMGVDYEARQAMAAQGEPLAKEPGAGKQAEMRK